MYIFFLPKLLNSLEKEACLSHFSCNEHHLTCNEITHICVHVCGIQVYSEAALQLASIYIFLYQPHPASLPLIWWLFWETEAYARPHRLRNTTHCVWTCVPVCVTADPSHSKNIVLPIWCQCAAFLPPLRRLQPLFSSFLSPSLLVDPGSLCYFIVRIEKCAEKVLKYFKLRRLERRQEAGCKKRGCMIHFFSIFKKDDKSSWCADSVQ